MAAERILNTDESTEINYRQMMAEFKEDLWPAMKEEGIPFGTAVLIYQNVRIENTLDDIKALLDEKYA